MKYKEALIPKTKAALRDYISNVMLSAPSRKFLEFEDFDGAFFCLAQGVGRIRKGVGTKVADQLLEMIEQAKRHYESGENKLGGCLLEDAKMVLMQRQPWAYPKDLYRWSSDTPLPEVSERDFARNDETD